ncbi:MAG: hypothetical protein ACTTKF_03750 [Bacteroides sp.]
MSSRFRNTILLLVLTTALVLLFVYNEDKWDAFIQFSLLLICITSDRALHIVVE